MKPIFLVAAAIPLMGFAPTGASIVSIGGGAAASCYHAAMARDASTRSIGECNTALANESLSEADTVATHVNRGVLRLVQANYPSAEADFNRAMAIEPAQPEAWLNMGISHYQQGRFASAARLFSRSLELRTAFPALAHYGLGLAYEDSGNLKGAYASFRRAQALDPKWRAPAEELKRFQVTRRS